MKKEDFQKGAINGWTNHMYFLWQALEATKDLKLPVMELGCGHGSTPYIREYCKDEELEFLSYDLDQTWADKLGSIGINDWENIAWRKDYSVVLVDESPGEHRKISLSRLHHVKIVVAHDTEPAADHGYQMRAELAKYKYQKDWESIGAWASVVSNYIDVSKW